MFSALFVSVALCQLAAEPIEPVEVKVNSGPHPCVFLTVEEAERVRERAETHPWAGKVRDGVVKQADALVEEALDIPHKGGQWSHWYTCKKDGASLKAKSPTEHVCAKCGTVYTGWPYDDVYVSRRHGHWFGAVGTLGMAYLLDPKPAYAEKVRAILLEYASFYRDLELHDRNRKDAPSGARLGAQTLDESCKLCVMAPGYDFVYDAPCFSAEDHKQIAEGLLRPMVKTILRNKAGTSNWQSWHNGAIAAAGFLLGDKEYVDFAVNDPANGFLRQMRDSVLESGMWFEGAPSYHWYALSAHVYLLEAAARAGMDLYSRPKVRGLFDGPPNLVFPDLTFPAVHDSDRSSLKGSRRYYEIAYRRYGDPAYAALLQPRDSEWALLWGADDVPEQALDLNLASYNSPSEGVAMLRDEAGETALYFDYSEGRAGHIHPCRLNIIFFAHGEERFVDPGRIAYGNPMQAKWFRQTVAHNTVVVNEVSQQNKSAELVAFAAEDGWTLCRATCEKAYKGVVLDRTLLIRGDTIVDVFRCAAEEASTFDLPLLMRGELAGLPEGAPLAEPFTAAGYKELGDVQRFGEPIREFRLETGENRCIHVQVLDDSESFTGLGYAQRMQERVPVVLRRQKGKEAVFAAVYQVLDDGQAPVEASCDFGKKKVGVKVGGVSVSVGEDTVVEIDGKRRELPGTGK